MDQHCKNWNKLTAADQQAWYDSVDRLRRAAKAEKAFYFQALVTPNEALLERIDTAIKVLTEV
jgi:hypothetical protein